MISIPASTQHLQSEKGIIRSSSMSMTTNDGFIEQREHIIPNQGGIEIEPQRTGGSPSYSFHFKCDERAKKREEFYLKLKEKMRAREVERTNLQMKLKESQEAEIKMLRKSLSFKATPMPSFYHKPSPPKVELKKTPPTRAKSPKLGRHRSSTTVDSETNSRQSSSPGQVSQEDKVIGKGVKKGYIQQFKKQILKKPFRKSLSKLLPHQLADATSQAPNAKHHNTELPQAGLDSGQSQRQTNH